MPKKITYDRIVDNTWKNAQKTRTFHNNPETISGSDFKIVMRVSGEWQHELKNLGPLLSAGYNFHGDMHGVKAKKNIAYAKEKGEVGFSNDITYYKTTQKIPPILERLGVLIAKGLDLQEPYMRIHKQSPGSMIPWHSDTFETYPARQHHKNLDLNRVVRVIVALTDWGFGQFWLYGTTPWHQWKAGDVLYADMLHVPHSTANTGSTDRYSMILMGIKGNKTDTILSGPCKNITVPISSGQKNGVEKQKISLVKDARYVKLSKLFEEQMALLRKLIPHREDILERLCGEKNKVVETVMAISPPSHLIPFLPVIPQLYRSIGDQMADIQFLGRSGYAYIAPYEFTDIEKTPQDPYYIVGVEPGKQTLKMSPDDALVYILKKKMHPLVSVETISVARHNPEILAQQGLNAVGTRFKAKIQKFIVRGNPHVFPTTARAGFGWFYSDFPHKQWGAPSCVERSKA